MKNLVLLGATGSIGRQTLSVLSELSDWNLLAATCYSDIESLNNIIDNFAPDYAAVGTEEAYNKLKEEGLRENEPEFLVGEEGFSRLAALKKADLVLNAIVGTAGLKPTLSALRAEQTLGLANKESLVIGGEVVEDLLSENDSEILPVDSEHNALFQLLEGKDPASIKRLILTASGGPFLGYDRDELKEVNVAEALDHPNWDMGNKITIDSATLMNKGLEVIEARWLFNYSYDKIDVIVHPESIVHSMIELIDGSWLAELGEPDMQIPIQYVMTYPQRKVRNKSSLQLMGKELKFLQPDLETFPCLKLAYESGKKGKSYPIVLNTSNEIAVDAFLQRKLDFLAIPSFIETMLESHDPIEITNEEEILALDCKIRERGKEVVENC